MSAAPKFAPPRGLGHTDPHIKALCPACAPPLTEREQALYAALEAAPEPPYASDPTGDLRRWYFEVRAAALARVKP